MSADKSVFPTPLMNGMSLIELMVLVAWSNELSKQAGEPDYANAAKKAVKAAKILQKVMDNKDID